MSDEHGWADFSHSEGHDEHGGHHDAGGHDEPVGGADLPFDDDLFGHHDAGGHDVDDDGGQELDGGRHAAEVAWDDQHEPAPGPGVDTLHGDEAGHSVVDVTDGHGLGPVGADPDAAPDLDQVSLFPPVVDVGPLPEPVDGFPWIDPGSLGLYHAGLVDPVAAEPVVTEPVPAGDLAAYAAQELPPGVDPWAALADSDDPATSALAKWWQPGS
jgi:hypothetical protein